LLILFFANGAIGIIAKWLKDGIKKPIAESDLILKLPTHGRSYFEQNA
jgi:hypothetical protein